MFPGTGMRDGCMVGDHRLTGLVGVVFELADPTFPRLDLISCRNLLIYLRLEAQAKNVSLF